MSPVTKVAPVLLNAPTAVNNAKFEVVPRSGACAKDINGNKSRIAALIELCNFMFIIFI
jgi:hypothetical protein